MNLATLSSQNTQQYDQNPENEKPKPKHLMIVTINASKLTP